MRFSKAALALAPGGVLAVFGSTALPLVSPLRGAVTRIFVRFARPISQGLISVLVGIFPEVFYPICLRSYPRLLLLQVTRAIRGVDRSLAKGMWILCAPSQLFSCCHRQSVKACSRPLHKQSMGRGGRLQLQYETHLYMAMQVV